jgi:AraC-like DNA-binding protein
MKPLNTPEDLAAARFLSGAASLDDAIDQAFSELPRKVRTIIRRWAVQDEPHKHGRPITVTTLARKTKVGRRTLTHYLTKANEENPTVFAMLKKYRLQRFRKAGRYEI